MTTSDARLSAQEYSKLRWRCRRGLLENDLFVSRYLERHGATLSVGTAQAMYALMDLSDNDLLDLLLRRKEPDGALATPAVLALLAQMRNPPVAA